MLRTAYAGSGIPLVQLNYETGEGLDEVRAMMTGISAPSAATPASANRRCSTTLAPALPRDRADQPKAGPRAAHDPRGRNF